MNPTRLPEVVFVDIDGTLTHSAGSRPPRPGPSHPLAGMLVVRGVPVEEAAARVKQAEAAAAHDMVGRCWPFGAEQSLGIETAELAQYIVTDFRQRYAMHPDAWRFMTGLRELPGLRVYPATTNPGLYILGKLASGDLADAEGTPVFDAVFGGEEVSVGGKCGASFYHDLLTRTEVHPDRCVMIGDEPTPDLDYALEAGLRRIFIVCREQSVPLRHGAHGGFFVNSLDVALSMIQSGGDTV